MVIRNKFKNGLKTLYLDDGKPNKFLNGHHYSPIIKVLVQEDTGYFISIAKDNKIKVYDYFASKIIKELKKHPA